VSEPIGVETSPQSGIKDQKQKWFQKKSKWKTNLRKCMTVLDTRLYFSNQKSEISMESACLKKFFFICNALPRGHFFVIISGISSESIYDRMVKGYHFIGLKWLAQPLSGHGAQ
jgi:hypothetical protein